MQSCRAVVVAPRRPARVGSESPWTERYHSTRLNSSRGCASLTVRGKRKRSISNRALGHACWNLEIHPRHSQIDEDLLRIHATSIDRRIEIVVRDEVSEKTSSRTYYPYRNSENFNEESLTLIIASAKDPDLRFRRNRGERPSWRSPTVSDSLRGTPHRTDDPPFGAGWGVPGQWARRAGHRSRGRGLAPFRAAAGVGDRTISVGWLGAAAKRVVSPVSYR